MKFTTFIAPAVLAYSASAATFKFNKTIKATPRPDTLSQVNKTTVISPYSVTKVEDWLLLNPTLNEAVLECESELLKIDNETRARFGIDGEYSTHDACAKIYAHIYSKRNSSTEQSKISKRINVDILDWFPELNTTYIEPWKSQGLN